jgi:hypothetical protein
MSKHDQKRKTFVKNEGILANIWQYYIYLWYYTKYESVHQQFAFCDVTTTRTLG